MPDEDTVYSPDKYRETEGIQDCTGYTGGTPTIKLTQGSSNWYTTTGVYYTASTGNKYNGTLYRQDYSQDAGYYYTKYTGTLYTGYSPSMIAFSDERDEGHTLYDSTSMTINGGSGSPQYGEAWVLAKSGTAAVQTFAFEMDDID